jgi:nitrous oxidase accessory protein NosD
MNVRKPLMVALITATLVGVIASIALLTAPAETQQSPTTPTNIKPGPVAGPNALALTVAQGRGYPGNPDQEARLVQAEDERLAYVRAVAAVARWRVRGLTGPYRLRTGGTFTLVLPARGEAYTFSDLIALAPDTLVRHSDGSYLLSESIAVLTGATLSLASPGGLTLRLESDPQSFVSIVTLGGNLTIAGAPSAPVTITSWTSATGMADADTSDGRAYLRVIGGHASLSFATLSNLGFWGGNTGGVAVTGVGRPHKPDHGSAAAAPTGDPASVGGAPLIPPSALTTLPVGKQSSLASASLDNVNLLGNAYGLFITNATSVSIQDTQISHSLVDGLVLHRFVSDARITRTTAADNGVDGFAVGRSCGGVVLVEVNALRNGRDGVSLNGRPLVNGPNASGRAVLAYGDDRMSGSTIMDNGRYGMKISGGRNIQIVSNHFVNNPTGVVLDQGADNVIVNSNSFEDATHQSIAVRDAVGGAEINRNTISGGDTGIYLRNSGAMVGDNTISGVSNHGISLVGDMRNVGIVHNSIVGFGAAAVWTRTATGQTIADNDVSNWQPAPTVASVARSTFQPLTVIWMLLGLLLASTALIRKQSRFRSIRDPYGERVPLTSLSKGIVTRSSLRGDH